MQAFIKAIESHVEWRTALCQHLDGQVFLHAKGVGNFASCGLGRWMKTEGGLYSFLPSLASVKTLHERFHHHAAEIVQATNEGDKRLASSLLRPDSAFYRASSRLVRALLDCSGEYHRTMEPADREPMQVGHLIDRDDEAPIVSIEASASVGTAMDTLEARQAGSLAVYQDGRFLGLFTEQSCRHGSASPQENRPLSQCHGLVGAYAYPTDLLTHCKQAMDAMRTRHLAVMSGDAVQSIVRLEDVACVLERKAVMERAPLPSKKGRDDKR